MTAPPREPRKCAECGRYEHVPRYCDSCGWEWPRAAPAPAVAQPAEQDALSHAWKSGYAQAKEEAALAHKFCPHCNPCEGNGNEKCRAPSADLSMPDAWPGLMPPVAQPAEPPATDDLVRWGNAYADEVGRKSGWHQRADGYWTPWHIADAKIERQAREIADIIATLHTEQDRTHRYLDRAERAEAERDALREVVKAADAMRLGLDCPMCDNGKLRNPAKEHWDTCAFANYDAARAKVKP